MRAMKSITLFLILAFLAAGQASEQYTWSQLAGASHQPVKD